MPRKEKEKTAKKPTKTAEKKRVPKQQPRASGVLEFASSVAKAPTASTRPVAFLGEQDLFLFNEGSHIRVYEKLGAHPTRLGDAEGVNFAVWAPNAEQVSVIGEFNAWDKTSHVLHPQGQSGIWSRFFPDVRAGTMYKYHIVSRHDGYSVDKADPFAFHAETPPKTGSLVWDLRYQWNDQEWIATRGKHQTLDAPMAIYEVHLGSWRRVPEEQNRPLTYRELAQTLPAYVRRMGFTHVEFLPVMEHPFYGSWGYEVTGYFAPTSRYGTPQDFMYLIDCLHQQSIGVILDWVPAHFPKDEHGLGYFDGTHLYEHSDPRKGIHQDWDSFIFNYGRNEVRSFLMSNALFWLDKYHADGLRIDAVASMLYLDYSRKEGEWIPNQHGGRENLEAISLLRRFNEEVYKHYPEVQTIAEESTSWPMVSRPLYVGGLGFGLKWDMGWMHDTLEYFSRDPIHRRHHQNELTFRQLYMSTENFMLPLSHDEVVHGKGSLMRKMAGDEWQKAANLRLLFGYMYTQSGKKLLFMGGELGTWNEWYHETSLDWHLLEYDRHKGIQRWVEDLNRFYRAEPVLYEYDCDGRGFEWVDCNDDENSVLSYLRKGRVPTDLMLVVCNFTPVVRHNYRVGVPRAGFWSEVLNSDAELYGGSHQGNMGGLETSPVSQHGHFHSLNLTLPPLAVICFKHVARAQEVS